MNAGVEVFEGIVCGYRPEGSIAHLAALVLFVLLAVWVSRWPSRTSHEA